MALTGRLGSADSRLGSIVLGMDTLSDDVLEVSAVSVLTPTQTATATTTRSSASSALSLSQTASAPKIFHKSASSTLTATQSAAGVGPHKRSATNTLSLTQEARSTAIHVSAESVLSLSDLARKAETVEKSASSSLSLTQSAVCENLHGTAVSELELQQFADNTLKLRSATSALSLASVSTADKQRPASNTLTLTQTAYQGIVNVSLTSALTLTQLARNVNLVVSIGNEIQLTQEVTSNIKMASLTQAIKLDHSLGVLRPWRVSAESELISVEQVFDLDSFSFIDVVTGLQDSAEVIFDGPRSASNIISFAAPANAYVVYAGAIAKNADSTLALTQLAQLCKQVSNEITRIDLTQTATAQVGIPVVSQLSTLGVDADVIVVRGNLTANNTLLLNHAVAFVFEKSTTTCLYSQFIGSSSDPNAPAPPPATYTSEYGTPGFRLQYPSSGGVTDEIILRAPNLGNRDRLSMVRINRETRGGTLVVFADPIWPKVQTLLLSFSGLSESEAQNLLTFMETHVGQEIRLIDWENRLWTGVVVNPQDPIVQDGPGCKYTASFEFEGQKV